MTIGHGGIDRTHRRPRTQQRAAHVEEQGTHAHTTHCNTNSVRVFALVGCANPRRSSASPTRNSEPVMTMASAFSLRACAYASARFPAMVIRNWGFAAMHQRANWSGSHVRSLLTGTQRMRSAWGARIWHIW